MIRISLFMYIHHTYSHKHITITNNNKSRKKILRWLDFSLLFVVSRMNRRNIEKNNIFLIRLSLSVYRFNRFINAIFRFFLCFLFLFHFTFFSFFFDSYSIVHCQVALKALEPIIRPVIQPVTVTAAWAHHQLDWQIQRWLIPQLKVLEVEMLCQIYQWLVNIYRLECHSISSLSIPMRIFRCCNKESRRMWWVHSPKKKTKFWKQSLKQFTHIYYTNTLKNFQTITHQSQLS